MKSSRFKNLINKKFGKLTVIEKTNLRTKSGNIIWKTKCQCGKIILARGNNLPNGHTKSCGCLIKELLKNNKLGLKHGKCHSSEYVSWVCMRKRCNNPHTKDYKNYGGRGIKICKKWNNFKNFYKDMGLKPDNKHTIDRIDNDKGYYPKNCKWSTKKEQNNNRRKRKCAK